MGKFPIKDLDLIDFYLNIKINRNRAKGTIQLI